jgi:hypothetical protein
MADVVATQVVFSGTKRYSVQFTNQSDGTGESDVKKIDLSTLVGNNGVVPTYFTVDEIEATVDGMTVELLIMGTTPKVLAILAPGITKLNYREQGGLTIQNTGTNASDLAITTNGQASGSSYTVKLDIRLKP